GRGHGDGEGRKGHEHAARDSERRRTRGIGPICAPNIFRSSFSNWQLGYAMGKVAGERGAKKVATITWKYAAGDESVEGFKDGLKASGGEVVKELTLPFPNVEFQALLTEIAATKPDAVYAFFA